MKAEIDIQLAYVDIGHATQSAYILEVESWANLVNERVRVFEILGMLIIFAHDVCT